MPSERRRAARREVGDRRRLPEPAAWPAWLQGSRPAVLSLGLAALALLVASLLPANDAWFDGIDLFPLWLHMLCESAAIVVSLMLFSVVWHADSPTQPAPLVVLACVFLASALLDFGHVLSYPGMPDFLTPASAQKSIAFWLAARLLASGALLYVAFAPWRAFERPQTRNLVLGGTLLVAASLYGLLVFGHRALPAFFVDGQGLTPLKRALETLVILATGAAMLQLWLKRRTLAELDVTGLLAALGLLVLSSLALSLYDNVRDLHSLIGHLCRVLAAWFLYRQMFVTSVRRPLQRLRHEIAQNEAMRGRLRTLEYFDALTGLPNRRHLHESVVRALAAGRIARSRLVLIVADVDRFTGLNEAQGHAYGDVVLRITGDRLAGMVGTRGSVFRFGADEFAVMLEQRRQDPPLEQFIEGLMAEVGAPMSVLGAEVSVSLSLGYSLAPDDAQQYDRLLQNAENALHAARLEGGGAWRRFEPALNDRLVARHTLRADLRRALERGEFRVFYQPQVDLASGQVVGAEALLRWQHPERGLILPGRFIPEAEDSGLIVPLSEWVLDEACHQAAAWQRAGLVLPRIAVNVSGRQLERSDFERRIEHALESSGLAPQWLELELTESMLVRDTEAVLGTLQRLKARGLRLALDDFGTGYSSLGYLRAFPIDTLKIDQSFVRDLQQRADNRAIVAAVIQLAAALGMQTLAEGVEDEITADSLRALGCREAQGFLWGRGEPPEVFAQRLAPRP